MESLFLIFYGVLLYAGFLVPVPALALAWYEWVKTKKASTFTLWRRSMSQAALIVCSLELALWSYTIFAEARGLLSQQSYYGSWISYVGLIGSIIGVAISVLAEGQTQEIPVDLHGRLARLFLFRRRRGDMNRCSFLLCPTLCLTFHS